MGKIDIKTLINSAQTVTASWVDVGAEISTEGVDDIGFWVKVTINDSANVDFRYLAKHASAHADEYEIMVETVSAGLEAEDPVVHELNRDIDQKVFHHFPIGGEIPILQMQVKAGTVGATGATIDEVLYDIS